MDETTEKNSLSGTSPMPQKEGGFFAGFLALRAERPVAQSEPESNSDSGGWLSPRALLSTTAAPSVNKISPPDSRIAVAKSAVAAAGASSERVGARVASADTTQGARPWSESSKKGTEVSSVALQAVPFPLAPVMAGDAQVSPFVEGDGELVGFLVAIVDGRSAETIPLRTGRWLINGPEGAKGPGIITIDDSSVSPFHATLRVVNSRTIHFRDQLSDHGTSVLRKLGDTRTPTDTDELQHGDVFVVGKRAFTVCIIPRD